MPRPPPKILPSESLGILVLSKVIVGGQNVHSGLRRAVWKYGFGNLATCCKGYGYLRGGSEGMSGTGPHWQRLHDTKVNVESLVCFKSPPQALLRGHARSKV